MCSSVDCLQVVSAVCVTLGGISEHLLRVLGNY